MDVQIGQVVEFVEEQRALCAVCLGQKGARYHLLTHLGRETNLSAGRFLHVSPEYIRAQAREARIKALQAIAARREAFRQGLDIRALWELVQGENMLWTPRDLAGLAFFGEVGPDHEAAVIRAVISDHTYFKFRDGLIAVQPPEVVNRTLEQLAKEQERLRRLERGVAWIQALWSRREEGGSEPCDTDGERAFWTSALKDFCLHGEEAEQAPLVRQLLREASVNHPEAAFESLVKAGVWSEDQDLELLRHEVTADFPAPVLAQAEGLACRPALASEEGREDLTGLHTFTIDAGESLDLDDALSFRPLGGDWEVGIHITDVGREVLPGTPAFEEALRRATTIYLPDAKIPMIPEVLSQGAWSLTAGLDRRALSFIVRLDPSGRIVGERLVRSIIRVHERLTYDEADTRIEEGGPLSPLYEFCLARQARRIESGALPLPIPELVIKVDQSGAVTVSLAQPGPARFLVSESMILANAVAARFLQEREIPGVFRSQPEPRERIISGEETDLLANFRQRRLISRVQLGTEPAFHHGLGIDAYTTVTSPLRRALDLLMQQQISSVLLTGRPLHTEDELVRHTQILGQGLATAAAIRQARNRYWLLKHIEGRRGVRMPASILETGPRQVLAVLMEYLVLVELPRHPGQNYNLGQNVEVCIKKVNARANILKVDWASGPFPSCT